MDHAAYEKGKAAYSALASSIGMLKNESADIQGFVDALKREHPTRQNDFARLLVACVEALAEVNPDMRNEDAVDVAKAMAAALRTPALRNTLGVRV